MKKSNHLKISIYDMCSIAIFTAVISILAQISIPMPTGVPLTLQTFAVTLTAIVLGAKKSAGALLVYLLLGTIGIPVFANFRGGLHAITSPTGGFLISFPVMAYIIGLSVEKRTSKWLFPLMITVGTAFNYISGLIFYCMNTETSLFSGFLVCVLPFLPSGIITTFLASILGLKLRKRLAHGSFHP